MRKIHYLHVIIYLWHGERHRFGDYTSYKQAAVDLIDIRNRGFVAWIESI